MVVNAFIIRTTDFLNKFVALCEEKLSKIQQGVARLEIVLALLEAKLESVPWLADVAGPAPTTTTAAPTAAAPAAPSAAPPAPPLAPALGGAPAAPPLAPVAPPAEPIAPPAEPPGPPVVKLKDDPRYGKYFKMLMVGVPKAAVQPKMRMEGLDPEMLEKSPDDPAPAGGESSSTALVPVPRADSDSE